MDAVQAVQIMTNAANPVPAGAGSQAAGQGGAAASNLFRSMFDEAAASVAPQTVSALFIKGAASPAAPLTLERAEAGEPVAREAAAAAPHAADAAPASRKGRKEQLAEARPNLTARGDGRKGGAKGIPPGILLEPTLLDNRQSMEGTDESVMENPSENGGDQPATTNKQPVSPAEGNTVARGDTIATDLPSPLKTVPLWQDAQGGVIPGKTAGLPPAEGAVPAGMDVADAGRRASANVREEVLTRIARNQQPAAHAGTDGSGTPTEKFAPCNVMASGMEARGIGIAEQAAGLMTAQAAGTPGPTRRDVSDIARGASVSVRQEIAPGTGRNSQPMEFPRPDDTLIPARTGMDVPARVKQQAGLDKIVQFLPPADGFESFHEVTKPVDAGLKRIATETVLNNTAALSVHGSNGSAGRNPGSLAVPPGFPVIDPESLAVPPGFPVIDPETLAIPPGFPDETDSRVRDNNRGGMKKMAANELEHALQRHNQELKAEVKGETVLRQLPGGVTVLNPAQTTGMGGVSFRDEGAVAVAQHETKGRTSSRTEGEQGLESPGVEPATELSGKRKAFSQWDGAERQNNPETGKGSQALPGNHASFGDPEAQVRGLEEVQSRQPAETDKGRLHEEILSQVREKLANHNPMNGDSRITLKLNPGELGELRLNVRMEDRKMSVEVTAQNPVVKEALLQNLDQLKDTLSRQNIQMERFDVSTGTGQQGAGQSFREGRQTAHRQFDDTPFSPAGYPREDQVAASIAGWEPRENSLVDMRL